ncbi:MAG: bifunctional DNA-formamidopyrimidine glycosylase/DNA-(apurinic or apyrimidinic site) lyase [Candidatus Wildermuthbacteria bacterium]|nr:bifunctional DNA-formamidopyrimidine glycosylase/DNA-(apurinic or apyrimidinic site) lyase [Candidatus Wildermuthbacteria bacterium]
MPELPEAETTKRKLEVLKGKTIAGFWHDWPAAFRLGVSIADIESDIKGMRVLELYRKGKAIFISLSRGERSEEKLLGFHQRMSGRLQITNSHLQIANSQQDTTHVHAKVIFEDGMELWFIDPRKFGVVWYGRPKEINADPYIKSLGPDALAISFEEFLERLQQFSGKIKPVLLRQDVFAGIGNIVADETLWEASLHPETAVSHITRREALKLFDSLKRVLERGIAAQGTSMKDWKHPDGEKGTFQDYFNVYGKKGGLCPCCQTPIIRTVVVGRSTWLCPMCQKL